jgi:hypothetical protein
VEDSRLARRVAAPSAAVSLPHKQTSAEQAPPPPNIAEAAANDGEAIDRLLVGESLPAVCYIEDVARILGMTTSGAHKLRSTGRLRDFLLPALPGDRKARFCGRRLQQWLDGEFQPGRVFGRRGARLTEQRTGREPRG